MNETVLVIGTLMVMLIGVAGAFLPVIPDVAIIWLAGLGYGLIHGFDWIGVVALVLMAVVAVVAELSETWMTGLGARATGASLLGILVGLGLMLLGTLLTSPVAGILAGLLGMMLVEYRRHRLGHRRGGGMWIVVRGQGRPVACDGCDVGRVGLAGQCEVSSPGRHSCVIVAGEST
jgi:uncharacterized protein YqgC (DUF456 family)